MHRSDRQCRSPSKCAFPQHTIADAQVDATVERREKEEVSAILQLNLYYKLFNCLQAQDKRVMDKQRRMREKKGRSDTIWAKYPFEAMLGR